MTVKKGKLARLTKRSAAPSQGFTLVELLVTMAIAMVILAGLYSNFLLQSRVQARQASTVDALEDLRLASQIMSTQLRLASNICWDATNKRIIYQPLGATVMTSAACNAGTVDLSWGTFQFKSGTAATGGTLCWDRPNTANTNCDQMMQGLNSSSGFQVSPTSNSNLQALRSLTLKGQYKSVDRQSKDLQIGFDVQPRNN